MSEKVYYNIIVKKMIQKEGERAMEKEYEGLFNCCDGCDRKDDCNPENCGKFESEILMEQMDTYYDDVM